MPRELNLPSAAEAFKRIREDLLAQFPELADDPDCLLDTLEGMTTIQDQLTEIARSASRDEAMLEGLTQYQVRLADRRSRLKEAAERKRRLVCHYMAELELKKLSAPDLVVTRKPVPPAVVITDEAALADQFVRVKREPDKAAIKAALKAGETVAGAELGNGGETISIKI